MARCYWTDEEIARLKSEYNKVEAENKIDAIRKIKGKFNHTVKAIEKKISDLGLERVFNTKDSKLSDIQSTILEIIRKSKNVTIGSISRDIDRSEDTVKRVVAELNEGGYSISISDDSHLVRIGEKVKLSPYSLKELKGEEIKLGVLSDTHWNSRYSQHSLINLAYEKFKEEKVGCVLHCGDVTDGNGRIYRGQQNEIFENRAEAIVDSIVENYPRIEGISTYICSGNHDLSFTKENGVNIIRQIAKQRNDIIWRGDEAADFEFKNLRITMLHPGQSACSYAKSYKAQKAVESEVSNTLATNNQKPDLILTGHFHYFGNFISINTYSIMVGCLQAQTPFMRNKALHPDVGFMILKINYKERILKFEPKWYSLNHLVREQDY